MIQKSNLTYEGTVLKMHIGFMYQGGKVTLHDLDHFQAEFFCDNRSRAQVFDSTRTPENGGFIVVETQIDGGQSQYDYYALVDTAQTGPGNLKMKFTAYIHDGTGIRKEIAACSTNVRVVNDYNY
jgi:hypothetical protein